MVQGNKNGFPDPEKEKKFDCVLNNIYDFLSVWFLPVTLCILAITLVLDFVPFPYCCSLVEDFFCEHDFSALLNTSLVIWTFVASLLVYFMGRMEDQHFGLRIYKVMLAGKSRSDLVKKVLVFLSEVVLLEISATYNLPITRFVVCMLQPVNALFIFLMITQETSRSKVVETINTQTDKVLKRLSEQASHPDLKTLGQALEAERKDWLLLMALQRVDYNSHDDMDEIKECISASRWEAIRNDHILLLLVSWKVAYFMLDAGQINTENVIELPQPLRVLLMEIACDPSYPDFFKVGILTAFLFNRECQSYNRMILDMLPLIKPPSDYFIKAAVLHILELLAYSEDEKYTWRNALLHKVKDTIPKEDYPFLNKQEKDQIDSFLIWLGYEGPETESEEPQEKDTEGEKISV